MWIRNDNLVQGDIEVDFTGWLTNQGETIKFPTVTTSNNQRIEEDLHLVDAIHIGWQDTTSKEWIDWGDSTRAFTLAELDTGITFEWQYTPEDTTEFRYILFCLDLDNGGIVWSNPAADDPLAFLHLMKENEYHFVHNQEGSPFMENKNYRFVIYAGNRSGTNFINSTSSELRSGDFEIVVP